MRFCSKIFFAHKFSFNKLHYFSHVKKKRGKIREVNGFIMEKHMGNITINFAWTNNFHLHGVETLINGFSYMDTWENTLYWLLFIAITLHSCSIWHQHGLFNHYLHVDLIVFVFLNCKNKRRKENHKLGFFINKFLHK
jgi:hypothetical protein